MPEEWSTKEGWTMYTTDSSGKLSCSSVDYPKEDALVFDVEVAMKYGNYPTMAAAVSPTAWYSWCSKQLTDKDFNSSQEVKLSDLIPLGTGNNAKIIVGHNVSFDRTYVKEQYQFECDQTRFMDTMSLHICISGLTGYQRALSSSYKSAKNRGVNEGVINDVFKLRNQPNPINWADVGAANSLAEVHSFYCKGNKDYIPLNKEARNVFVEGTLDEIRSDFQRLMSYCAKDVQATSSVFNHEWLQFVERFPHPVTLAGMLEMSVMYLPCNKQTWNTYLVNTKKVYDEHEKDINKSLTDFANDNCKFMINDAYKSDPWLWDLDWSVQDIKYRKNMSTEQAVHLKAETVPQNRKPSSKKKPITPNSIVEKVLASHKWLNKKQPHMPGYPQWYRDFSLPHGSRAAMEATKTWSPGPYLISTQMRTVPKLLRMMWDGFALHYDDNHGWGFLVPTVMEKGDQDIENGLRFPYEEYVKLVKPMAFDDSTEEIWLDDLQRDDVVLQSSLNMNSNHKQIFDSNDSSVIDHFKGYDEFYRSDVNVYGCRFYQLPHKLGPGNNVGNPLGKDFLRFVEEGRLTAYQSDIAHKLLSLSKAMSYWKMNSKRITSQMAVTLNERHEAAILPRAIVAGTVTRRAVEPTWLTASNAYKDRIGSELKAMISAPAGYKFVGADVDSQELWIASLLGDSFFAKIHGSTGIGWMTLQGTKTDGTDMHSKTAQLVKIDRNQAKILNYGRIYGAGKAFAARFLKQSNPEISDDLAKKKANDIYKQTKGHKSNGHWKGGTESHMFNKLEEVAKSSHPETPVLRGRISRALEAESVRDDFVTSLINWVVQSSAVDYLHLMLVSMKWLCDHYGIKGRFAISIHDEVRYIVKDEDVYRAALALQISNLLTRSIFCYKLGMKDLPQSVAFFSSVDIDSVLRKEVDMNCVTPSNRSGLEEGYGVQKGESLNIFQLIEKLSNHEKLKVN
ncbi:DNA polymerase subunit gamma-1 [Halotydeus destructor]|nr:DNA polymerase subunit gamma-1 [Halotydeus destructor]